MLRTAARRARPGFTLVELMVAAAVCVLIMAILAGAFSLGIDTYRQMKSSGDMMDQLRGAGTAMKADLAANHLMTPDGTPVKLSSIRADQTTVTDNGVGKTPRYTVDGWAFPTNGFVRIGSSPFTYPGSGTLTDADGLNAGTGIATTHYLHFTSILSGNSDDEYFRAAVPQNGQTYHSIAAEIAWFLEPMPSTGTGPTLHRLIRRQRLCALSDTDRRDRPWPNIADEAVISLRRPDAKTTYLSTLAELTNPSNRHGGTRWVSATNQVGPGYAFQGSPPQDDALAPMASRPGEDTVLSNVISFEVQVQWTGAGGTAMGGKAADNVRLPYADPLPAKRDPDVFDTSRSKTDDPFDTLPKVLPTWTDGGLANTHTYDSWTQDLDWRSSYDPATPDAKRPPLVITVRAVQVRIRIWDPKMQTGRQISFVQ
ncbi:MAG TPA: prepilin-type N-terminal cleavage/methylation domain-containing protein, partial [Urbifossiella sp.]|nr:prepilin-type N-terminal cleavage/methylation domain-containing protein [Urbifossiella sp.]